MAKKKNRNTTPEEENADNYYELHTEAIEKLVTANEETAPEIPAEQPNPYKTRFLSRIPNWIKALFIKFWFNGAACFFFLWGLSIYIKDIWSQILVLGIALGIITDVLVNNLFRFMQSSERENDKWMMLPMKAFWTFFVNILYALVVSLLVVYTYQGINTLIINIKNLPPDSVPLGVEPLLFGLMYLVYDLVFIGIKDATVLIVKKFRTPACPEEAASIPAAPAQPAEKQPEKQSVQPPKNGTAYKNSSNSKKKGGKKKKHKK